MVMNKTLPFICLFSLLLSEARAEPNHAIITKKMQIDRSLRVNMPLQFLFVADSVVFRDPLLSAYPFPPTAKKAIPVWEKWGLKPNPVIRANVIDSTDSIRFFGRVHKAAVWDARVR